MKKKIITQIQKVRKEIAVYIANDGTKFNTEQECLDYERQKDNLIELSKKLQIEELDYLMPLIDEETRESHAYMWYKIENTKDFKILAELFKEHGSNIQELTKYPEIMCIDAYNDYYPYNDYACSFTLSDCKQATEKFWEQMGYKVTIEKE